MLAGGEFGVVVEDGVRGFGCWSWRSMLKVLGLDAGVAVLVDGISMAAGAGGSAGLISAHPTRVRGSRAIPNGDARYLPKVGWASAVGLVVGGSELGVW